MTPTVGVATAEGADTDPAVARTLTQTVAGPFLLASMGFAAMLVAANLLTLRTLATSITTSRRIGVDLGGSDVSRPSRTGDRA